MIRITKVLSLEEKRIVVNPSRYELGRSAYLCYSESCINKAIKEKKVQKMLRISNAPPEVFSRLAESAKQDRSSHCSLLSTQQLRNEVLA